MEKEGATLFEHPVPVLQYWFNEAYIFVIRREFIRESKIAFCYRRIIKISTRVEGWVEVNCTYRIVLDF